MLISAWVLLIIFCALSCRKPLDLCGLPEQSINLLWKVKPLLCFILSVHQETYFSVSHFPFALSRPCFFFLHCILLSFIHSFLSAVLKQPAPEDTVTASFGKFISEIKPQHLSPVVLHRSKRMVLDNIGVGLIGSTTDVFELALQHCQVSWGKGLKI